MIDEVTKQLSVSSSPHVVSTTGLALAAESAATDRSPLSKW